MEFGICGGKIDDIDYIRHAENLGYQRFWVPDSQMIWSDCYAVLALAAQATSTIQCLGFLDNVPSRGAFRRALSSGRASETRRTRGVLSRLLDQTR